MLKVATVCTGIGAPEKALKFLNIPYELAFFSEIDEAAIKSYCKIHNEDRNKNFGDLKNVDTVPLPNDIDLIVGGTPCQDFSLAGKGAGGEENSGTRSSLMWYYVKLISLYKPKIVIWENVPGVLANKHIRNYQKFMHTLNALGYKLNSKLINSKYFNVPQNRLRVFVVAIRKDLNIDFEFPYGYDSGIRLKDILQKDVKERFFIKKISNLELFKPRTFRNTHRIIKVGDLRNNNYRQDNVVISIDGISDCLMAQQNCSKGSKIYDYRFENKQIRRLTDMESLILMGFTHTDYYKIRYKYVKENSKTIKTQYVSENDVYKQAGNSIVVQVMMAILGAIYKVDWKPLVFKERYKTEEELWKECPLFLGVENYEIKE